MKKNLTASKKKGLKSLERPIVDRHPNQWVGNPKQETFVDYYIDPKSKTFGNIYQSAVLAGYSDSYARKIASSSIGNQWIGEYVKKRVLNKDHIEQGIINIAITGVRDADKLRAYELLAKLQGLIVDKSASLSVNANLEQLISELK